MFQVYTVGYTFLNLTNDMTRFLVFILKFKKTGKNLDSLSEGKKFFHVFLMALPMIVEELD